MVVANRKRKNLASYAQISMSKLKKRMTENSAQEDTEKHQNNLGPATELLYYIYKKTENQDIEKE
jgi:hypothetical protein